MSPPISLRVAYAHHCPICSYLATLDLGPEGVFDLYHCRQDIDLPTLIARFGDNGADYYTHNLILGRPKESDRFAFQLAYSLATQRGLIGDYTPP